MAKIKLQSNLFIRPPLLGDHSSKTTNTESAQAISHKIVTASDDHLSNATSDHFFVTQMKKNLSKTTTAKVYPVKKWEAMHKKIISLQLYLLYCYLIMQSLFNVCNNRTFTFKIGLNFAIILVVKDIINPLQLFIFTNAIHCCILLLWVGYFIYFNFTRVSSIVYQSLHLQSLH